MSLELSLPAIRIGLSSPAKPSGARLEEGSGFSLNQASRQTAALQAFARLSWQPDLVDHRPRRDTEGSFDEERWPRRRIAVS